MQWQCNIKSIQFNVIYKRLDFQMKKFEEVLKQKAHLNKIKNAKKTIAASSHRGSARISSSKISQQSQLLLNLYQNKNFDSIPAYKLLRTANLQQYTKGFIIRGYGINLGKLAFLTEQQKNKLYQDLKVLPGHTVKLDKIINAIVQSSYSNEDEYENSIASQKKSIQKKQVSYSSYNYARISQGNQNNSIASKKTNEDIQYEKQLQRVLNQYTPSISDEKRKTHVPMSKVTEKKSSSILTSTQSKNQKSKYLPPKAIQVSVSEFKKKSSDPSTKSSVRKSTTAPSKEQLSKDSLSRLLKNVSQGSTIQSSKVMEIQIDLDKYKALNKSFDGALMSSTIANLDIQELVYAFSGLVASKVIAAPEPKKDVSEKLQLQIKYDDSLDGNDNNENNIQDQVGSILRESYLHPLYRQQVMEDIQCEQALSEGQNQPEPQNQFIQNNNSKNTMLESSFLGGQSFQFGLNEPIKIFQQPEPTQIDYFKPTVDSVSNFIKNIVLAAKMQRQIPVMAAAYFQTFLQKSQLVLTSLNYKRLLVICLLLASKIWDDESFQTPSFSKTFPQYSTMLLNEMEKQVVKMLDYKLKLGKKEYAKIYFKLRKYIKTNIKSYQNKKLNLQKIRQLQNGVRKQYRINYLTKRASF